MITPIELGSKAFNKVGLGYDKKDVDSFMKEVISSYETLYKENVELKDKINALNDGIQYYKTIEKTIQKALILAEQTSEETKEAARQNAKSIEDKAKVKASMLLEDAKYQLNEVHQKTVRLTQQYELYKTQFKNLAAAQLELLQSETFQIHVANLDAFIRPAESQETEEAMDTCDQVCEMKEQFTDEVAAAEDTLDILAIENI